MIYTWHTHKKEKKKYSCMVNPKLIHCKFALPLCRGMVELNTGADVLNPGQGQNPWEATSAVQGTQTQGTTKPYFFVLFCSWSPSSLIFLLSHLSLAAAVCTLSVPKGMLQRRIEMEVDFKTTVHFFPLGR